MSLLQDALRKAQRESAGPDGGTPLPEPGPLLPRRRSRRSLVRTGVLLLFLLAVGGLYLFRQAPAEREAPGNPPELPSRPAQSPPATSPPPAHPPPGSAAPRSPAPAPAVRPVPEPAKRSSPAASLPVSKPDAVRQEPVAGGDSQRDDRAALLDRYNRGIQAQERGEWEPSARLFREIVDADPSVAEAWNGLGFSLMRLGRLDEAEAAIARALSLSPEYPAAVVNGGLLRLQEGRTAEAAERFARAAALDPSNPVPRVNLAIAQGILGNLRESERTLSAARRRFPSDPEILYNLGALYERVGDRERSAEAYAAFLSASRGRIPAREDGVRERLRGWGVVPE